MTPIFADTSGWANILDRSQPLHPLAVQLYQIARQNRQKIITTNYIITELVALLTSPLRIPRKTTIALIQSLKSSPYIEVIHISSDLDTKAWELLINRVDKEWSLVDCSSFVLMQEMKLSQALTTDHHFEQAGFIRLLK
ncbi:MAG: PIN domain-containing protein [Crocosphaera sp.]|nr:PIN domain-containing protein [Crocosphaera sp.]